MFSLYRYRGITYSTPLVYFSLHGLGLIVSLFMPGGGPTESLGGRELGADAKAPSFERLGEHLGRQGKTRGKALST